MVLNFYEDMNIKKLGFGPEIYSICSQLCYDMPVKLITEWLYSAISTTRVVYKKIKIKKLFFHTCKKGIFLNIYFQSQSKTP